MPNLQFRALALIQFTHINEIFIYLYNVSKNNIHFYQLLKYYPYLNNEAFVTTLLIRILNIMLNCSPRCRGRGDEKICQFFFGKIPNLDDLPSTGAKQSLERHVNKKKHSTTRIMSERTELFVKNKMANTNRLGNHKMTTTVFL